MKSLNKHDFITKYVIFSLISFALLASDASADFNLFLQNKLGDDREVTYLFSEIVTDTGDIVGNPGRLNSPVQPDKLLRLASKLDTDMLSILNLMSIEYQCISNPGSTDCWSYDPDYLSFPSSPLYCDFKQNIIIDTSDKIISGTGTTGQITHETKQVRIILNPDFTITYRVIRKNTVRGNYTRSEQNMTLMNNGIACNLAI